MSQPTERASSNSPKAKASAAWAVALALFVVGSLAAGVVLWISSGAEAPVEQAPQASARDSGPEAPTLMDVRAVSLTAAVGSHREGQPTILRPAKNGEILDQGELLLLRYRVHSPAYITLLLENAHGVSRLWHKDDEPMPAGEHEVTYRGVIYALDPATLGEAGTLAVLASPVPFRNVKDLYSIEQLQDPQRRQEICPGCAADWMRFESRVSQ